MLHTTIVDSCPNCGTHTKWDATSINVKEARKIQPSILRYIAGHPGCSAMDIYTKLDVLDIPMYLALNSLVEHFEVTGPAPYACGCPSSMREMVYSPMCIVGAERFDV